MSAGRSEAKRAGAKWLALALSLAACGAWAGVELPAGPHRDLVYGKCRTCHDLQYLKDSAGITRQQWEGVVSTMEGLGLDVSDSQKQHILAYLGTYLGPNPPKASAQASAETKISGEQVYASQCMSCHQQDGTGVAGEFPPLAGNPDLSRSREFPALVVLNGLQGAIRVNGKTYDGQMPSFSFLSDEKVSAVVNYVRNAWGNHSAMDALQPGQIKALRSRQLDPQEVHAYRASHDHGS